ncbi:MAG: hypothetical protein DMG89_15530 [Acidobacteria bacterium]|nr:MAG: hypothetical protein DMG89_15530 [Acidobacteriota bacterium]
MQTTHAGNENVWKQAFKEAVLELDPTRLQPKLEAAQAAIEHRLLQARTGQAANHQELMELQDARRTIQFLWQEC